MLQRIKKAIKILIGRETEKKERVFTAFQAIEPLDSTFIEKIKSYQYEFIFTEFGEERVNAGGAVLSQQNRLEPSLSGIKKYFPNAKITVYTDFDWQDTDGLNIIKVESPVVDTDHPRFGYRTSVYFRFKGMLESKADFACAIDTDMVIVNENIYALVMLTQKFGFCAPYNIRQLLKQDMVQSLDTQPIADESLGMGRSYNQSPMTLWKGHSAGEKYYTACKEIMQSDPSRGSLVMWKAAWETGVHPYVLPKQFCVCDGDVGCDDEVILHIGHPSVAKYYKL
ncbi:hypothetical protein [Weeksella sp. HMSC059D05]|uniref:hypothetical protein n=1 Tax=Weeksella sp. HMSC059D05 TaxID=1715139 RepID=UPI0008A4F7DB|nr:hypothetical protein [Weeksella sp. HMSC059D05]OFM81827.1 hypothetical protein HMPREF2660_05600 [Weeksella sp. HMSC059D05]